jgi:hypothetical protein
MTDTPKDQPQDAEAKDADFQDDEFQVIWYRPENHDQVMAFYQQTWCPPPQEKDAGYFDWQFLANPYVENLRKEPLPLILSVKGDEVVGQLALIPTPLWMKGQEQEVTWGRDLYVNKEYRRNKLALRMFDLCEDEFPFFFGSGQSAQTLSMQKKYKWQWISDIRQHEKLLASPLDLGFVFADGPVVGAKRLAGATYATLFRARNKMPRGITVAEVTGFHPDLQAFWVEHRDSYGGICSRDHATLTWRFCNHPYISYRLFEARDAEGRYLGYIVGRLHEGQMDLVDIFTAAFDGDARKALILTLEDLARREGARRMVVRSACLPLEASLKDLGFMRTEFAQAFYIKSKQTLPVDADKWYITAMDSDLDR